MAARRVTSSVALTFLIKPSESSAKYFFGSLGNLFYHEAMKVVL